MRRTIFYMGLYNYKTKEAERLRRFFAAVSVLLVAAVAIAGFAIPSEATSDLVRWEYRVLIDLSEQRFNELGGEGYELFYANSETGVFIFKRPLADRASLLEYRVVTYPPGPDFDELGVGGWLYKDTYFGVDVFVRYPSSPSGEYLAFEINDWLQAVEEVAADQFGEQIAIVGQSLRDRLQQPKDLLTQAELVLLNRLGEEGWLLQGYLPGMVVFYRTKGPSVKPLEYYAVAEDEWLAMAEESPTAERERLNELGEDGWYFISRGLPASIGAHVFVREQYGSAQWEYRVVRLDDWNESIDQRMKAVHRFTSTLDISKRTADIEEEMLTELGAEGWKKFNVLRTPAYLFIRPKRADVPSWEYFVISKPQWDEMVQERLESKTAVHLELAELVYEELLAEIGAAGWEITQESITGSLVFLRPASR